ncbi:MAG: hypothetical protein OQK82_06795 [Candidatus Pacearchaeota archaeon]|nr:hypothetical protein [Candidatus Pacearchaeota archaeon]
MRIVGFNFNKINIEKFSDKLNNLNIKTNIDVADINSIENKLLKTENKLIVVKFIYNVDYTPNFAKIELSGSVMFEVNEKKSKEIVEGWKKKQIPEDFKLTLFNVILRKSNVKALQLEDDMNLPLHISLPSLKKAKKE